LSTTLSTKMTGISLHMQWTLTLVFSLQIKLHTLIWL
jgi:hypothetical protein